MSRSLDHQAAVNSVTFGPDGSIIVTTGDDRRARVWDTETGAAVTPWLQHDETPVEAEVSPMMDRLVTAGADHKLRIYHLGVDKRSVEELLAMAQFLSGFRVDESGTLAPLTPELLLRSWCTWKNGDCKPDQELTK